MTESMEIRHTAADPRLCAVLETARSWTLEQGMILAEIDGVLCAARKLLRLLPRSPDGEGPSGIPQDSERADRLGTSSHRGQRRDRAGAMCQLAGPLAGVLCLPEEDELQDAVCCAV
jgi:hypothetical protein